jgi:myosin heavy subunit
MQSGGGRGVSNCRQQVSDTLIDCASAAERHRQQVKRVGALLCCKAAAKWLYSSIFDWLVRKIDQNSAHSRLKSLYSGGGVQFGSTVPEKPQQSSFIGILDILIGK